MKRFSLIAAVLIIVILVMAGTATIFGQTTDQWTTNYFPNQDWAGAPVYTQITPTLSFNWGTGSPGPNMPADNWTSRSNITSYFYSGNYRFSVLADDEAVLVIDNVTYLDTRGKGLSGKTQVVDISMNEGYHNIRVDFREFTGNAYLYVSWVYYKPGSGTPAPPPSTPLPFPLVPTSQATVVTKYGDYTPCIQANSHQSNCFQSDGAWNSPNLGSIQLEPQITVWMNCEPPDADTTWTTDPNTDPVTTKGFRCSKTLAGWFQR